MNQEPKVELRPSGEISFDRPLYHLYFDDENVGGSFQEYKDGTFGHEPVPSHSIPTSPLDLRKFLQISCEAFPEKISVNLWLEKEDDIVNGLAEFLSIRKKGKTIQVDLNIDLGHERAPDFLWNPILFFLAMKESCGPYELKTSKHFEEDILDGELYADFEFETTGKKTLGEAVNEAADRLKHLMAEVTEEMIAKAKKIKQ